MGAINIDIFKNIGEKMKQTKQKELGIMKTRKKLLDLVGYTLEMGIEAKVVWKGMVAENDKKIEKLEGR
jgi:hypothetical protein